VPTLRLRGAELAVEVSGEGPPLLCLHETATSHAVWGPLVDAIGGRLRLMAPDRRGWGGSTAPEGYRATTVEEQAEDAVALLAELGGGPAAVCGAGIGAVVALALVIGHPELVHGAALIEPPLLAFSAAATERLSKDRIALGKAVQEGGQVRVVELSLNGAFEAIAPGLERLPAELTRPARDRPEVMVAELGAVPAWSIAPGGLASTRLPVRVLVSPGTPALVREASEALSSRLAEAELRELGSTGPAHLDAPAELAPLVTELSGAGSSP
jgi:pimeloyl-ACP methyl ester carboxylesterase